MPVVPVPPLATVPSFSPGFCTVRLAFFFGFFRFFFSRFFGFFRFFFGFDFDEVNRGFKGEGGSRSRNCRLSRDAYGEQGQGRDHEGGGQEAGPGAGWGIVAMGHPPKDRL